MNELEELPYISENNLPRKIKYNPKNQEQYDAGTMTPSGGQNISVVLTNFKHEILEHSLVNFSSLKTQIDELENKDFILLNGIDHFGYTSFNELQIPRLEEELGLLNKMIEDPGLKSDIAETLRFTEKVTDLRNIEFLGD